MQVLVDSSAGVTEAWTSSSTDYRDFRRDEAVHSVRDDSGIQYLKGALFQTGRFNIGDELDASIPETPEPGPEVLFSVSCQRGAHRWKVQKTFEDFTELHIMVVSKLLEQAPIGSNHRHRYTEGISCTTLGEELGCFTLVKAICATDPLTVSTIGDRPLPHPPPRHWWWFRWNWSPVCIEKRVAELNGYLTELLGIEDVQLMDDLDNFFHTNSGPPMGFSGGLSAKLSMFGIGNGNKGRTTRLYYYDEDSSDSFSKDTTLLRRNRPKFSPRTEISLHGGDMSF